MTYKTILVDDHVLVRDGVKSLFNSYPNFEIVGEFGSSEELFLYLEDNDPPDILILDLSLPKMSGIDALKILSKDYPDMKVIVLSMHKEKEFIMACLDYGIKGYIFKVEAASSLGKALENVPQGKVYFSKEVYDIALQTYVSKKKERVTMNKINLTTREKEVIKYIAEGLTSRQIGEKLFVSSKTIDSHRSNIIRKLEVKNLAGLIRKAMELKLI